MEVEDRMNLFSKSLEFFRMKKVKVRKNGSVYIGFVERMEHNQRHVVLKGAEKDGNHVGSVFLSHVEEVFLADKDYRVERVDPSNVEDFKYAMRSFSVEDNIDYIEDVSRHGCVKSFPLVTEINGRYGVVDGHKRIWACRQAGVSSQPCRVVELSNMEALKRFAWNHFPTSKYAEDDGSYSGGKRYSDENVRRSLECIYSDFGSEVLDIYPIKYNYNRLDFVLGDKCD